MRIASAGGSNPGREGGIAPSPAAAAFLGCLRDHLAEIAARGLADMPQPDGSGRKGDRTKRHRAG